jgi:hypothetical protein
MTPTETICHLWSVNWLTPRRIANCVDLPIEWVFVVLEHYVAGELEVPQWDDRPRE